MKANFTYMGIVLGLGALAGTAEGLIQEEDNRVRYTSTPLGVFSRLLATAPEDPCKLVEECSLCDALARAEISECGKTGRVERWQCEPLDDGEEEPPLKFAGAGTRNLYRSCNRTKADDEFLMVRFQVVCVLIGTAAFVSARKQKVLSASLFDQRKLGAEAKKRRRDSTATHEVEMTPMEETIPLTEDMVDVV